MKGRKPKPTALRMIDGDKDKKRINKNEPKFEKGADCPEHLSVEAKKEWDRIYPELDRIGLMTVVDSSALAAYCQAYGHWVEAEKILKEKGLLYKNPNGGVVKSPMLAIANKSLELMHKFLIEFGMTPSSRNRVSVKIDEAKESISKFMD